MGTSTRKKKNGKGWPSTKRLSNKKTFRLKRRTKAALAALDEEPTKEEFEIGCQEQSPDSETVKDDRIVVRNSTSLQRSVSIVTQDDSDCRKVGGNPSVKQNNSLESHEKEMNNSYSVSDKLDIAVNHTIWTEKANANLSTHPRSKNMLETEDPPQLQNYSKIISQYSNSVVDENIYTSNISNTHKGCEMYTSEIGGEVINGEEIDSEVLEIIRIEDEVMKEDHASKKSSSDSMSKSSDNVINSPSQEKCDILNSNSNDCIDKAQDLDPVREIVEFDYISSELMKINNEHTNVLKCDSRLKCVTRRRFGLVTKFSYKCRKCNYKKIVCSESPETSKKMGINQAAILGTINNGIGHTQLAELLASFNVNCMTDKTYRKNQQIVLDILKECANESMKLAGEEEKQLAIANGQVHNGIPWIMVVTDGSWMTRSYGSNYNSLSGLGVIIGARTGKVLFVGVRNKCCSKCEWALRNGKEPTKHKCYKNWSRNAPSTAMESDAILEGFKCSVATHGLIYKVIVTDGDSSVYKNIVDNNVYREHNIVPTRIRCYNHLQRNLCKKLTTVSKTTQPRGSQRMKNFINLRNKIKDNIYPIRKLVEESVDCRKEEQRDVRLKIEALRQDILNIPSHLFGEHKNCKGRAYRCLENDKPLNEKEANYVPYLIKTGMYQKVEEAIKDISNFSESLLHKLSNNIAESFNNIVCVEIGGKRINFGLYSSYLTRVYAAVIRHNTQELLSVVYAHVFQNVPPVIANLDYKRQAKVAATRHKRALEGRKRNFYGKSTDKYYGQNSQDTDKSEEDMRVLRESHLKKLREQQSNRETIEMSTRDQYESMEWISLRKELLTASHFGHIIRSQESTSCAVRVKSILYPSTERSIDMQYGLDHEMEAIQQLEKILDKKILKCGLHIDPIHPYLACTPDGLIDKDGVVEIKTSLQAADLTAEEAIARIKNLKTIFKKNNKKNDYELNQNHHFYYQVQGQLHITGRSYCIFALWTPKSIIHTRIEKNDIFWNKNMEFVLDRFYMECMLPEILDSRYNRSMPIRDPPYILKAKESKMNAKAEKDSLNPKTQVKRKTLNKTKVGSNRKKGVLRRKVLLKKMSNDNEVEFVSHDRNYIWSESDNASTLTFIEQRDITVKQVEENVLPVNSKLNDDSLDALIRLVQKSQNLYEMQSVMYEPYERLAKPITLTKGIAIIGSCHDHWRVAYYDGNIIKIYDSLIAHTGGRLHVKEKKYLNKRFPNATKIVRSKMSMQQPDGCSCGVYSAAMVVDIVLGVNPSNVNYSLNVLQMREHFIKLLIDDQLSLFPRQ